MNLTQQDLDRAILDITSGPEWDVVKKGLYAEIYQVQAGALDSQDYGELREKKGYAKALAYVAGLREMTIKGLELGEADANL